MIDETSFTKEISKKVKSLEIKTRKLVNDSISGHYHSVFKGQGMDFNEIREYIHGDEVKNIDWNVTARQGHPHIKIFNEERERTILLAVDISPSTIFGSSKTKKEIIAEVASVISLSAGKNSDKVGLVLFTDRIELYIPPSKGRTHLLRIIRELLFFKPIGKSTDIINILDFINKRFNRKIITFLISDYSLNNIPENLRIKLNTTGKHHDLISLRIRDKNELELPNIGIITLEDLESGEVFDVDTSSKKTREKYKKKISERDILISNLIKSCGIDLLEIDTETDYMPTLLKFFILREKRA